MLILTRCIGESIVVGEREVIISVLGTKGSQVRLGLQAKTDIPIHRDEIYQRIQSEKAITTPCSQNFSSETNESLE